MLPVWAFALSPLQSFTGDTKNHATFWNNGIVAGLGTLCGTNSSAWRINHSGQVVGDSCITGDSYYHAVLRYNSIPLALSVIEDLAISRNDWNRRLELPDELLAEFVHADHRETRIVR